MVRLNSPLVALVFAFALHCEAAPLVSVSPLVARQAGSSVCNSSRQDVITDLAAIAKSLNDIQTAGGKNATVASAVSQAQTAVGTSQAGIANIIKSALVSTLADAQAGDGQVASGVNAVEALIAPLNASTNAALASNAQALQSHIKDIKTAGLSAIVNCAPNTAAGNNVAASLGLLPNSSATANSTATSANSTSVSNSTASADNSTALASSSNSTAANSTVGANTVTETVFVTATAAGKNAAAAKATVTSIPGKKLSALFKSRRAAGNSTAQQCSSATLKAASSALAASSKSVQAIASASKNDTATSSAVKAAQSGLTTATNGVSQITKTAAQGQNATVSGRDQLGTGVLAAQTALNGINSTDSATVAALNKAQASMISTLAAAESVGIDCAPIAA